MAYFVGYGYSGGFTAHMAQLLEELTPDFPVRLTVGTDAVCGPCPNNDSGRCDQPELVAGWDQEVLNLCGLSEGSVLSFGRFTQLVEDNILALGLRSSICGTCQWNDICASHPSRWASPDEKRKISEKK